MYRGKVVDINGQPLVGANIVTVFRRPETNKLAGVITDFNGEFIIGDVRPTEAWKITYVGFHEERFNMPRGGGNRTFILKENVTELEGVVVRPRTPIDTTPVFNPNEDLLTANPNSASDSFRNFISRLPDQNNTKKGFWDTLKDNPLIAVGLGLVAALGVGALLSTLARSSDKTSEKQLANAKG
ncbi:MAG: carboxypeptidase-like regulatory domain-containing protein [Bacteroidota bacterium]